MGRQLLSREVPLGSPTPSCVASRPALTERTASARRPEAPARQTPDAPFRRLRVELAPPYFDFRFAVDFFAAVFLAGDFFAAADFVFVFVAAFFAMRSS